MCGSPSPRPRLRLVEFAPPLHRSRTSTWSDIVPGLAQAIARLSMKSSTSSKASSRMENASNRHRRYQQSAPIVIRSEYKMAPEERLEPTTLRLTALPAASPMVPSRPLPSLLELPPRGPCPRSSPPIPAETQDSAIISPSLIARRPSPLSERWSNQRLPLAGHDHCRHARRRLFCAAAQAAVRHPVRWRRQSAGQVCG